ncbi:MAG TPA: type 1 glutamine amidotransferase domain-containing protein [Chloroflexota bacterium]|nr:type 1 glutamine amidotransferase domain-containing protein [Chloroflexota bacterium]
MADRPLQDMRVAIVAATDFEQVEMVEPRKALEDAGAKTVLVSTQVGNIDGMKHDKKGDVFEVEMALDQADPADFDGVMLPGGALNADHLRVDPKAQAFVRHMYEQGKPMAVICHAPWLLVSAGLVRGRTLTSYYTIQDDIRNAGGTWVDRETALDGNLLTSRKPDDIPAFNREMVALFARSRLPGQQRVSEPVSRSERIAG